MPDQGRADDELPDVQVVLEQVEEQLGADVRAALEAAIDEHAAGDILPDVVVEAMDGELKPTSQKMATGGGYGAAIADRFGRPPRATGLEPGARPVTPAGVDHKANGDAPDELAQRYQDAISEAFGTDG